MRPLTRLARFWHRGFCEKRTSLVLWNEPIERTVVLTLNRPERANALSAELVEELRTHLHRVLELASARPVRCVMLILASAHERIFSAGADLKQRATQSPDQQRDFTRRLRETLQSLAKLPCFTAAALRGGAYGGGLELALACDFRIVQEGAILALPETGLGILPGAGGTQRLPRLIGVSRAKEVILLGRRLDARQAHHYGLVNVVVPDADAGTAATDNTLEEALQLAASLRERSPMALQLAKRAIDEGIDASSLARGLAIEDSCYAETFGTKDRAEGLQAFVEKRSPRFTGE
jgi:methylglutaconyl-CoA hydratase